MLSRRAVRFLSSLGFLSVVGFFAVGCTLDESPAIKQISAARNAIHAAAEEGAKEKCPEGYADLEQRYLKARGIFYACNEDEATTLAQQVTTDAEGLLDKCLEKPMVKPDNQPPIAELSGPLSGVTNELLSFSAVGSSDPDGTITSYSWDYGDGNTASFTFPRATHRYENPGTYLVQLTVEDDKGATGTASQQVEISPSTTIPLPADVLFDFDSDVLRPEGEVTLDDLADKMDRDGLLRAEIVGHTDNVGSAEYNLGLSKRRAEVVANYLIDKGIASDHLSLDWKGEEDPQGPNDTKEERQQNRRVDITFTAPRP